MGAHRPRRGSQGSHLSGFASVTLVEPSLSHLDRRFTYAIPDALALQRGALVRVPFRGRNRRGIVTNFLNVSDVDRTLEIKGVLGPGLGDELVDLAEWVSRRYLSTLGEALAAALPQRVAEEERALRDPPPVSDHGLFTRAIELFGGFENGPVLARAVEEGSRGAFVWRPPAHAARGVAVAELVRATVAPGGGAIILLPEVRVRSEVAGALEDAFGSAVAWLGADRTARERYRDWLALRSGGKRIAVGGRAAVFAPVGKLSLIVVDDEAHASYKEARAPRYHARTVAAERARRRDACLVLIGTPPSIEAHAAIETDAFTPVCVRRSDQQRSRPPVTVIDLSAEPTRLAPVARTLQVLKRGLEAGGRVVVLAHRSGTELDAIAERTFRVLVPRAPVRLDARATAAELARAAGEADCIVSTPFIAKDLDLKAVRALAIVSADAALAQPEFRAAEDAFAVWWRAARWVHDGQIVIESADPAHAAVSALVRWDPDVLWRAEASRRRDLGYPPFAAVARIDVPAERSAHAADAVRALAGIEVLGPVPSGARSVILVRAPRRETLLDALRPVVDRWRQDEEPMRIDVDPWEVLVPKWRS